jgi:DNA processing protein
VTTGTPATRPGLDDRQRLDWLRLARSENVGPITFRALVNRYGGAGAALEALPELSARGGLKRSIRLYSEAEAEAEIEMATRLGARLIALGEPCYPMPLSHIETAPPLLYVIGDPGVFTRPMVALVGARNCSAAGRRLAERIAGGLAAEGLVVVSGLARGIDAAAHVASMASGTVAVLAGGHAHIYPEEHVDLAREIAGHGALVSEMPPDWVPRGKDFPRRNRIISGLARGVVVVEAAARSGSLITARRALDHGREVFAVPGSPLDPRSEGANRLIREGATLTRSAEDVLEVLRPTLERSTRPPAMEEPMPDPDTPEAPVDAHGRLLEALGPSPVEIDELARHTGLSVAVVMQVLIELELAGRLERHPGQRVSLV